MKTIRDIEYLQGVKVLVRADFNVPIKNGVVADDFRIRVALPTIDFLRSRGAKVILVSHLESLEGDNPSLRPVAESLVTLGTPVTFITDLRGAHQIIESTLRDGECVLLENLRFNPGEKAGDVVFAQELASLADIYVNDAFSVSHRAHASIVAVPRLLPSYVGLQFEKEVTNLSRAFVPLHPFVFVLGGAKFDTKLPLIKRFSETADDIFLGGALGNDALVARGISVGASKVSDGKINISDMVSLPNILVPIDAIIQDRTNKAVAELGSDDRILDAGMQTLELLRQKINSAKFVLWNGPLGPYEDGYVEGTEAMARMIAEATQKNGTLSIVGGGDTLAALAHLGIEDKFSFVSSGGGAMLDFLADGTLVGIEALEQARE